MFVSFSRGTCLSNTQADAFNRMLEKSASGSCSFGLSGLFGLFGLSRLFG